MVRWNIGCCGIWKTPENIDIFHDCILLYFMQNLLNFIQNILFLNDPKKLRYLHWLSALTMNHVLYFWPGNLFQNMLFTCEFETKIVDFPKSF
jgi:hypothetical protein